MITTGPVNPQPRRFLIWDTLYGVDEKFEVQLQMVAGYTVENDGKLWMMMLRDGLKFHDGEPVRGRDVVASLKRWASRDVLGNSLFNLVDEVSEPDDKTVRWRLKLAVSAAAGSARQGQCEHRLHHDEERPAQTDAERHAGQ